MDTVVLAGGRGERLGELTAPFHKPLLPNGDRPIVTRAVEHGQRVGDRVIVVCAPENTVAVSAVLGSRPVYLVVQRRPTGPATALRLGLELVRSARVLVLMADNVTSVGDVDRCVANDLPTVGVRRLDPTDADRFTVWNRKGDWEERVSITSDHVDRNGKVLCWCGPLVLDARRARRVLAEHVESPSVGDSPESLIGPILNDLAPFARFVEVDTRDIGSPDTWEKK